MLVEPSEEYDSTKSKTLNLWHGIELTIIHG